MDLVNALNRADPSEWGAIKYGMPIFVEHDGYEVDDGKGGKNLVVVPRGEQPPAGGKKVYTVDRDRLQTIAAEINREYQSSGTPVKLFIGHSDPKTPQTANPPLAGYGRGAYLGTFGPQNRPCIQTDAFYRRGSWTDSAGQQHSYAEAATEYPERSPEFLPRTNGITGIALLKTDPRLKMGMVAYSADREIIYYGVGFMPPEDDKKKPDDNAAPEADAQDNPAKKPPAGEKSPASPQPFAPHEIAFADRLMAHLEQNHPAIKHLCGEYKKYQDTQAAMAPAAAGATNGCLPGDTTKKPKPDESLKMSDQERIDFAETQRKLDLLEKERAADQARIAQLEEQNAILYAEEALATLEKQGKVIKDKTKEIKKLVAMKTLEERQSHLADIKLNYADAERSPASRKGWLPVDNGHPEGAETKEQEHVPEATEMLRYAQDHKIDMSSEDGVRQVVEALTKKKPAA